MPAIPRALEAQSHLSSPSDMPVRPLGREGAGGAQLRPTQRKRIALAHPTRSTPPNETLAPQAAWHHLPGALVGELARMVGGGSDAAVADAVATLRLCCSAWRAALPPGVVVSAKVGVWCEGSTSMASALAPSCCSVEVGLGGGYRRVRASVALSNLRRGVTAPRSAPLWQQVLCPLRLPTTSPLPQLASSCHRLTSLRLEHVHADALAQVGRMPRLRCCTLVAVHYPRACSAWLAFAAGLVRLERLSIGAAVLRLQPEEGLGELATLRHLTHLRLDGVVLLTEAGVPALAALV